ncbi:MAG: AraC family transcriptional regulator [Paenibacillus sp.]|nr:AraC family transcriptional regulator [Paenibacillus sp.]
MWKVIDHAQISTAIIGHQNKWEMDFHRHDSYEWSAVLEGSGFFQCDEGPPISLEAGHVVLIPPNVGHRYWTNGSIRFGVLHAKLPEAETRRLFRAIVADERHRLIFLPLHELDMYESLFRNWLRAVSQPLREHEQVVATWIRLLLLTLLQSADNRSKPMSVAGAADYIRENVDKSVPIQVLAKMAGVSESSFRRLFHETYGISPKQYLQRCRMTEAKWLLRASNKPIQFVSEQTGFMSIHAFSAWFQKMEGLSPNEWRKRQRGEMDGLGEV